MNQKESRQIIEGMIALVHQIKQVSDEELITIACLVMNELKLRRSQIEDAASE